MHRICMLSMAVIVPLLADGPPQHGRWTITFSDEFTGTALDPDKWDVESGVPAHILSSRWPENIEVRGGVCRLVTKKEQRGGKEWTTAHFWTRAFRQKYGYFEARYRYAPASGLNNAFWLMTRTSEVQPKTRFELDINEGHYPNDVHMNVHQWAGKHWADAKQWNAGSDLSKDFHTYGFEWNADELIWYFDGEVIRRRRNDIAHGEVPVIFSTAVLKWAGEITDQLDGAAMEVDWVRVYERNVESVLVEAESFDYPGGWVVDQQFMDQMGSPFLLAHGLGVPVADARTTVRIPRAGVYHLWVRTRDWVAAWKAPGAPGKFQLTVNGAPLKTLFGTEGALWHWQDGGTVRLSDEKVALGLHDLTGFDGRCDAILLSADLDFRPPDGGGGLAAFRRRALRLPDVPAEVGEFDLVVVGGGMAGTAAAISAARLGLNVALVHDRPVLGGNNSSDVRVHLGGNIQLAPFPALGAVVAELDGGGHGNAQPAANYDDERKLAVVKREKNIRLFLNTHAFGVEKSGNRIAAIVAKEVLSGREWRFRAPLFVDATGDGAIGYLAGADHRYGRESRAETGESLAPDQPDRLVMGTSVMWYSEDAGAPSRFPDCPWALPFTEESAQHATRGDWDWEAGQNQDQIGDFEAIRDHGLRAVYGNWAFQKNHSVQKAKYANLRLGWVAYVGGKRESRRLLGDVILQQQDIQEQHQFPDASVTATWSIDLHYPKPQHSKHFPGQEFRSVAEFGKKSPYAIPYRCFYSRNIENLFMAGRNISVTHVALGTVRVMRTTGMMGEVVGMAATVARKHGATPRGVYERHLDDLKQLMQAGVGKP